MNDIRRLTQYFNGDSITRRSPSILVIAYWSNTDSFNDALNALIIYLPSEIRLGIGSWRDERHGVKYPIGPADCFAYGSLIAGISPDDSYEPVFLYCWTGYVLAWWARGKSILTQKRSKWECQRLVGEENGGKP